MSRVFTRRSPTFTARLSDFGPLRGRNVPRMLDRLAQAAERQNQLDAMVERLVRENGELREEMDNLLRTRKPFDEKAYRASLDALPLADEDTPVPSPTP